MSLDDDALNQTPTVRHHNTRSMHMLGVHIFSSPVLAELNVLLAHGMYRVRCLKIADVAVCKHTTFISMFQATASILLYQTAMLVVRSCRWKMATTDIHEPRVARTDARLSTYFLPFVTSRRTQTTQSVQRSTAR